MDTVHRQVESIPDTMQAWVVADPVATGGVLLERVQRRVPTPGPRQLLVRVEACGVCRIDLHLAEGDLPPGGSGCTARAWSR